jgi:hypothetical protein
MNYLQTFRKYDSIPTEDYTDETVTNYKIPVFDLKNDKKNIVYKRYFMSLGFILLFTIVSVLIVLQEGNDKDNTTNFSSKIDSINFLLNETFSPSLEPTLMNTLNNTLLESIMPNTL